MIESRYLNKQESNVEAKIRRSTIQIEKYVKFENKIPKYKDKVLRILIDLCIQN